MHDLPYGYELQPVLALQVKKRRCNKWGNIHEVFW